VVILRGEIKIFQSRFCAFAQATRLAITGKQGNRIQLQDMGLSAPVGSSNKLCVRCLGGSNCPTHHVNINTLRTGDENSRLWRFIFTIVKDR
jgi:hypothetical protein